MDAEIKIMEADPGDLPAIHQLQQLAYQSEAELLGNWNIPPLQQTVGEMEQELARGVFLKAVDGRGNLVGSVRGYEEDNTLHIGKLMVHPCMQGQGLGRRLLAAMEQTRPGLRCELFTSSTSNRNLSLYRRAGYHPFREESLSPALTLVYLEKQGVDT